MHFNFAAPDRILPACATSPRDSGRLGFDMDHTVSRRSPIGALGAGAQLSLVAGALTFPSASVPTGSRELCARARGVFTVVGGALGPGHVDVQPGRCVNALRHRL